MRAIVDRRSYDGIEGLSGIRVVVTMMLVVQLAGLAQRARNWRFRNTKRWNCWLGEAVGPWNVVSRV